MGRRPIPLARSSRDLFAWHIFGVDKLVSLSLTSEGPVVMFVLVAYWNLVVLLFHLLPIEV